MFNFYSNITCRPQLLIHVTEVDHSEGVMTNEHVHGPAR